MNSLELTLESVQLVNYYYGDVYELWRDCEVRGSQAHPGGERRQQFRCSLKGGWGLLGGSV